MSRTYEQLISTAERRLEQVALEKYDSYADGHMRALEAIGCLLLAQEQRRQAASPPASSQPHIEQPDLSHVKVGGERP